MGALVPFRRIDGATEELSDDALILATSTGDRAALAALFDRFHTDVYRFLARIASGHLDAIDDLVQATFLEAYRASARFGRRSTVRTWIFGIASNIARHHIRDESRRLQ